MQSSAKQVRRVLVFGGSGTIGQAALDALVEAGHEVVAFLRKTSGVGGASSSADMAVRFPKVSLRFGDVTDPVSLREVAFAGAPFDAVVSCLASRTGAPKDAWAIDHDAHQAMLLAGKDAGVPHFVLLSAICVQKPNLAFQKAKLAFEASLQTSGLTYSIVRPTAFFKSLSGQVARCQAGKPFLLFGDGEGTECKPISDRDLGRFLAACVTDPTMHNQVLPIGGPGPAMTPRQQGAMLFDLLGQEARYKHVPLRMMDVIVGVLATLGRLVPKLADKADLARIGRYYATESMLVWDGARNRYDADATPEFGADTLKSYYAALIDGSAKLERGDHAVF
ncbi:MAG: NAD(P)H-binding protein [Pseudomonadota bacterium]